MSGFESLGAAAAIIQLTETGIKYGKKAIEFYESKNGLDRDFRELDQLTLTFRSRNQQQVRDCIKRSERHPNSDDEALIAIAVRCEKSAANLLRLVDDVRMKERTKWQAAKAVFRSEARRGEIEATQRELRQWRTECQELLQKMILDGQYNLARILKQVSARQAYDHTQFSRELLALKQGIISMLHGACNKAIPDLAQRLLDAQDRGGSRLPRDDILTSLFYKQIDFRRNRIAQPTESTYDWIFNRHDSVSPPVHFVRWLEEESDTFWVTGWAGSGKSTLMKFIRDSPLTEKSLQKWARGRDLLIADHYFWCRGDGIEKSHEGLLRSILHRVLDQCPGLIEQVCELRWEMAINGRNVRRSSWSLEMLKTCAGNLSRAKLEANAVCFCFFVDGLDECDDDTRDVIKTLKTLAACPNIKICASSRPWNEFETAFEETTGKGNWIEVHKHTARDIEVVINTELKDAMLSRNPGELDTIVSKLVTGSHGIFLWVVLVLRREIIPMLEVPEDMDDVLKTLDRIPSELTEYFNHIFEKVWRDTKFREQTSRIFLTCIAAKEPIPLACLEVLKHGSPERFVHEVTDDGSSIWGNPEIIKLATRQIKARCYDLLCVEEIVTERAYMDDTDINLHRIEFLHRTVADFFVNSAGVCQTLERYSGPDFNAETTLFACFAYMVKGSRYHPWCNSSGQIQWASTRVVARSWCTACLVYCPKASAHPNTLALIEDVDEAMSQLYESFGDAHWTNYLQLSLENMFVSPVFVDLAERTGRDLTSHLIEFGIVGIVEHRLCKGTISENQLMQQKKGRPYLDYALRYDYAAMFRATDRALFSKYIELNPALVEMLLSLSIKYKHGGVGQQVSIYNGRTLWDLYLSFLHDNEDKLDKTSALAVTRLLIRPGAGARNVSKCVLRTRTSGRDHARAGQKIASYQEMSMRQVLEHVFGKEEGMQLASQVGRYGVSGWKAWIPWR